MSQSKAQSTASLFGFVEMVPCCLFLSFQLDPRYVCNMYAILYNMHAACSAELLDSRGELADQADAEVTFSVSSGEGKVIATHNGAWETQQTWGSLSLPVILFLMF